MNELIHLRERLRAAWIVINPRCAGGVGLRIQGSARRPFADQVDLLRGSTIASLFLQPIPGSGDTAVVPGPPEGTAGGPGQHQVRFLKPTPRSWRAVVDSG